MPNTKIATCCYCGTRAALVLDSERHALACASCGAPLHNMKALRAGSVDAAAHARPRKGKKGKTRHEGWHGAPDAAFERHAHVDRKRKRSRKGFGARLFEEAFDLIEDILD